MQVLPADGVDAQRGADGGFGVGAGVRPVGPDVGPERLDETVLVAVAVLGDEGGDPLGVLEREAPSDGGAVVLDVEGVAVQAQLVEQSGGEFGEGVEGVGELPYEGASEWPKPRWSGAMTW